MNMDNYYDIILTDYIQGEFKTPNFQIPVYYNSFPSSTGDMVQDPTGHLSQGITEPCIILYFS